MQNKMGNEYVGGYTALAVQMSRERYKCPAIYARTPEFPKRDFPGSVTNITGPLSQNRCNYAARVLWKFRIKLRRLFRTAPPTAQPTTSLSRRPLMPVQLS